MRTITEEVKELKTPVFFKIKPLYKLGEKKVERAEKYYWYYSGRAQKEGKTKNRTYLQYITRNEANRKFDLSREEILELNKLRKTNLKKYYEKIKYYNETKPKNTGLWSKEGLVNNDRLKEIEKNLLKINADKQFVWDTVISFSELFCEKYNIYNQETIYNTLKDKINMLFWAKNIDPDKMEWFFAFHTNTDNPHVHLFFYEKEPTRIGERYESEYNFDQELLEEFRFTFARDMVLKEKNIEINEFNKSRENLVEFFKKSLKEPLIFHKNTWQDVKEIYNDLSNNYDKILQEINQYNKVNNKEKFKKVNTLSYNLLSKTRRNAINRLINHVLKNDNNINNEYKNYVKNLGIYEDVVNEINNNKECKFKYESLYGKDGLYSRIGNKILYAIKRNIDVSKRGVLVPKHHSKIMKIKVSIIGDLMKKIDDLIFKSNKFVQYEIKKTKEILENRQKRGK